MPLHDWATLDVWENFHSLWISRLHEYIQPRLPAGYRVFMGSYRRCGLMLDAKPDVAVGEPIPTPTAGPSAGLEPDAEVAVAAVDPERFVYVQQRGAVVAAVELISPRNKDRPSERAAAAARYAGYVRGGIHLLLVDVHPSSPPAFSFADEIDADIGWPTATPLPPPMAVAYRVGERAGAGGSYVAVWRRPLTVGQPLPTLPLPLGATADIAVDLEETYTEAARRAYLA